MGEIINIEWQRRFNNSKFIDGKTYVLVDDVIKILEKTKKDIEGLEQDYVDCACLLAIENKAFEMVCKEFNQDEEAWLKKAEHELYGGKDE